MTAIFVFLAASVLWQEDFDVDDSMLRQLYDYQIEKKYQDGSVKITAHPQFEGFAASWLYLDKEIRFMDDDLLKIRMRVNANAARIRYFFRKEACGNYYAGEYIILNGDEWQNIEILLKNAQSYTGSEFPIALTPGKTPSLYLFIENAVPGDFDIDIDYIAVLRVDTEREQK